MRLGYGTGQITLKNTTGIDHHHGNRRMQCSRRRQKAVASSSAPHTDHQHQWIGCCDRGIWNRKFQICRFFVTYAAPITAVASGCYWGPDCSTFAWCVRTWIPITWRLMDSSRTSMFYVHLPGVSNVILSNILHRYRIRVRMRFAKSSKDTTTLVAPCSCSML